MRAGRPGRLRHQDALAAFDRAASLDPGDPAAWNNRAVSLWTLGRAAGRLRRLDEAADAFRRAETLLPNARAKYPANPVILRK